MQAMSTGSVVQIEPVSLDPMLYTAHMRWIGVAKPVIGKPQRAITDALNSLNDALQEDCAREMMERGQA